MSVPQAAVTGEPADSELAGIGITLVPDHLRPSPDGAGAAELAALPALAPAPGAVARARPRAPEQPWPRQFALLLAETLTGVRPQQQIQPWLSQRGSLQLHRLLPLFNAGHRPRVLRVVITTPSTDAVEMTLVVLIGPRARALAVRLERRGQPATPGHPAGPARRDKPATGWVCTDIEAG